MTEIRADNVQNRVGTGKPDFDTAPTHSGGSALSTLNSLKLTYTSSGTEPSSPSNGDLWWDSTNSESYIYVNNAWYKITLGYTTTNPPGSATAWSGDRAVVAGTTYSGSPYTQVIYFNIAGSGGGSADFGGLTQDRAGGVGAAGSSSRGCFVGGYNASTTPTRLDDIDYVTPSTTGNATAFGNLTVGRNLGASASNGTRLLHAGGFGPSAYSNTVDYITVATTGNAQDFGDLSAVGQTLYGGAAADATRALVSPVGNTSGGDTTIDYFTIATTGNATDFGDLIVASNRNSACSDETRCVFVGGGSSHNPAYRQMEYVTIQTTGNATNFGDLLYAVYYQYGGGCTSNATIGVSMERLNMEKFTIQTPSNGVDFGDLSDSRFFWAATSGSPS